MPLELIGEEAVLSAEEFLAMVKGNCGSDPVTLVSPTPGVLTPATLTAHLPGARIEPVSASAGAGMSECLASNARRVAR